LPTSGQRKQSSCGSKMSGCGLSSRSAIDHEAPPSNEEANPNAAGNARQKAEAVK
jgi:hypothetical protein